jgi:hypothetical protein
MTIASSLTLISFIPAESFIMLKSSHDNAGRDTDMRGEFMN